MTIELDLAVRCPTCGAAPGAKCVTQTEVPRRAATHAARRAMVHRLLAPFATLPLAPLIHNQLRIATN
jgi:hypothetical protein